MVAQATKNEHRQVDRRLATGVLAVVHDGVYPHAAAPVSWEGRLLAALLATGQDAFAPHHSAMRLHGIRGVWDDTPGGGAGSLVGLP
jgi:hypothetical protein